MSDSEIKLLLIIGGVTVAMAIGIIVIWRWKVMAPAERERKSNRINNTLYKMYIMFPLTKKFTQRCVTKIRALAVQTKAEVKRDATKTATKGFLVFIGVSVGGMFIVHDLICRALMFVLAAFMMKQMLAKRIQRINLHIMNSLSGYIGLVREEYLRRGSIADALEYAECPESLKLSVAQIREIMSAADAEHMLNRFLEKNSCDFIKVFAIACIRINDMGDDADGPDDEPTFIRVLKYLEEDVNADIERREYSRRKFGTLEMVPLMPVVAIDLLPAVLSGSMPGLNVVYEGVSGYIIKVLIMLAATFGYYAITILSQVDGIEEDDRIAFFEKMIKHDRIAYICEAAAPKRKYKVKAERLMHKALTKKSLRSLTAERITFAFIAFLGAIIIGFAAGIVQKDYAKKSTNTFGLVASNDLAAYPDEKILQNDQIVIDEMMLRAEGDTTILAEDLMDDIEIRAYVDKFYTGLSELQAEDQVTRIKTKYNLINSGYFHWFFVLIAYAVAVGFYFVPILILKFRLWNIKKQEQEEFLRLQTLCTIIAISDADVLSALESMYKLAKLYKEPIKNCYLNYTMDPHKELERLNSKVELTDFKRLIKKLQLAVEDLSLKEAFEGMEIERKHIVTMRAQQTMANIDSRREKAGMASKISMAFLIIGLLIFPVIYVGFTELVKVFDSLNAM